MSDEPTLLPCPFCGGEAAIEEIDGFSGVRKSAGCNTEGCFGFQSMTTFETRAEAVKAWNRRATTAQSVKSRQGFVIERARAYPGESVEKGKA